MNINSSEQNHNSFEQSEQLFDVSVEQSILKTFVSQFIDDFQDSFREWKSEQRMVSPQLMVEFEQMQAVMVNLLKERASLGFGYAKKDLLDGASHIKRIPGGKSLAEVYERASLDFHNRRYEAQQKYPELLNSTQKSVKNILGGVA